MKQSLKSFLWSEMNKISTQFFNNEKKITHLSTFKQYFVLTVEQFLPLTK